MRNLFLMLCALIPTILFSQQYNIEKPWFRTISNKMPVHPAQSSYALTKDHYIALLDSMHAEIEKSDSTEIFLVKDFLYDKYTLEDEYKYKKEERYFQWEKIKALLAELENIRLYTNEWIYFSNYKNRNGVAPIAKVSKRNEYNLISDKYGVPRWQGVPLYTPDNLKRPELYGEDGALARVIGYQDDFIIVEPLHRGDIWWVPKRYTKELPDHGVFNKAVVVDRRFQNITTLERKEKGVWLIRSMNPATTGVHKPPYSQPTPLGMFVLQQKKPKMIYLKDGTKRYGGYSPYAMRFNNGGYIHGVPVNAPRTKIIEYGYTLGTTPRSHMCVRNATSHAKFIYDWAPVNETIIFVIE